MRVQHRDGHRPSGDEQLKERRRTTKLTTYLEVVRTRPVGTQGVTGRVRTVPSTSHYNLFAQPVYPDLVFRSCTVTHLTQGHVAQVHLAQVYVGPSDLSRVWGVSGVS